MGSMWALLIMEGYPGTDPVAGFIHPWLAAQLSRIPKPSNPSPQSWPKTSDISWRMGLV
jgi:hypothetical protein